MTIREIIETPTETFSIVASSIDLGWHARCVGEPRIGWGRRTMFVNDDECGVCHEDGLSRDEDFTPIERGLEVIERRAASDVSGGDRR